jgi:hypothetical protein
MHVHVPCTQVAERKWELAVAERQSTSPAVASPTPTKSQPSPEKPPETPRTQMRQKRFHSSGDAPDSGKPESSRATSPSWFFFDLGTESDVSDV